jgi:fucose permease
VSLATQSSPSTLQRPLGALSLAGFVALGLPDGMWGAAWPAMQRSFDLPVGDLGLILLCVTGGALLTSLNTARAMRRFGTGATLAAAGITGGGGAAGLALASSWWQVLAAGALIGACAGLLDTGLNIAIAMSRRTRLLNVLHGSYGIGTTVGPAIVTVAVLSGSWRPAYLILLAVELLLGTCWWATRARWRVVAEPPDPDGDGDGDGDLAPRRPFAHRTSRVTVALGVGLFFCYTGLEVTAGQWAATYLRGPARMTAGEAGAVVTLYWGALTAARFAVALPHRSPSSLVLVRAGCSVALVGALLVWWDPASVVLVVGMAVLGAALAPVFPALVSLTPDRVGPAAARHVIGWQLAGASVGGAGLSALAGLVFDRAGLFAYGPYLVGASIAVLALALLLEHTTRPIPAVSPVRPTS